MLDDLAVIDRILASGTTHLPHRKYQVGRFSQHADGVTATIGGAQIQARYLVGYPPETGSVGDYLRSL